MNLKKYWVLLFAMSLLLCSCSKENTDYSTSDVSGLSLEKNDFSVPGSTQFQFLVFSHAYGDADIEDSIPSQNLITNIDNLLAFQPEFAFSLGDMVRRPTVEQFDTLESQLLTQFSIPVFNAVGNHDVMDRALYNQRFGSTYYSFTYGNSVFFVLDTEIDACSILGEQKAMLETGIAAALEDETIDQIFIMMHKVLFLDQPFEIAQPNDQAVFQGNNFQEIMNATLIPAAKKKTLYLFAGDVGAFGGNLSPFYNKIKQANLYTYAAGIGDTDKDVVFIVSVDGNKVTVKPYRLADQTFLDLNDYDTSYWEAYGQEQDVHPVAIKQQLYGCAAGICRFAKNTFHLRCSVFFIGVFILAATIFTVLLVMVHKKKQQ
jgi:hypothetical protein